MKIGYLSTYANERLDTIHPMIQRTPFLFFSGKKMVLTKFIKKNKGKGVLIVQSAPNCIILVVGGKLYRIV